MDKHNILYYFVFGAMLLIVMAIAIILFLVQYHRKQIIHSLEKTALQSTFDNQLLQSRLEVQEQSFQYFSEEIHDNVGQVLSVAGMHLYQLQQECTGDRAIKLAEQSSELLNKAITDLRTISHTLNAQYIGKAGLVDTLQKEISYINAVRDTRCSLEITGDVIELPAAREILLFRILQESLNNALKHAAATSITVSLSYGSDTLTAVVKDNGTGFDAGNLAGAKTGLGLTNMQLRAKLLGGGLGIDSAPGRGTTFSLTISTSHDVNDGNKN